MNTDIRQLIEPYIGKKGALIPILQKIQNEYGYLSEESISTLAHELKISENVIYGVATFYAQFRFTKPGKYQISACSGTACHVRGGRRIMNAIERELKIKHGETTDDGLFSLERVACMGCCALAPVMAVDDRVYASCKPAKVKAIIKSYEEED